jgi:hypothetical protein
LSDIIAEYDKKFGLSAAYETLGARNIAAKKPTILVMEMRSNPREYRCGMHLVTAPMIAPFFSAGIFRT